MQVEVALEGHLAALTKYLRELLDMRKVPSEELKKSELADLIDKLKKVLSNFSIITHEAPEELDMTSQGRLLIEKTLRFINLKRNSGFNCASEEAELKIVVSSFKEKRQKYVEYARKYVDEIKAREKFNIPKNAENIQSFQKGNITKVTYYVQQPLNKRSHASVFNSGKHSVGIKPSESESSSKNVGLRSAETLRSADGIGTGSNTETTTGNGSATATGTGNVTGSTPGTVSENNITTVLPTVPVRRELQRCKTVERSKSAPKTHPQARRHTKATHMPSKETINPSRSPISRMKESTPEKNSYDVPKKPQALNDRAISYGKVEKRLKSNVEDNKKKILNTHSKIPPTIAETDKDCRPPPVNTLSSAAEAEFDAILAMLGGEKVG